MFVKRLLNPGHFSGPRELGIHRGIDHPSGVINHHAPQAAQDNKGEKKKEEEDGAWGVGVGTERGVVAQEPRDFNVLRGDRRADVAMVKERG